MNKMCEKKMNKKNCSEEKEELENRTGRKKGKGGVLEPSKEGGEDASSRATRRKKRSSDGRGRGRGRAIAFVANYRDTQIFSLRFHPT